MKIMEKETHEAKYLLIEYEDGASQLDDRLIDNLDSRSMLRPHSRDPEGGSVCYDISHYEPFSQYLVNRKLSRTEMVGLLAQMKSVIGVLEDHMLSDTNLLLDPRYIQVDTVTRRVRFLPVHAQEENFTNRLRPLLEAMFLHADTSRVEALYFAAELMKLCLAGEVHMHDMMQLIDHQPKAPQDGRNGWEGCGNRWERWQEENTNAEETEPDMEEPETMEEQQETVLLSADGEELPFGRMVSSTSGETEPEPAQKKNGIREFFSGLGAKVKELAD